MNSCAPRSAQKKWRRTKRNHEETTIDRWGKQLLFAIGTANRRRGMEVADFPFPSYLCPVIRHSPVVSQFHHRITNGFTISIHYEERNHELGYQRFGRPLGERGRQCEERCRNDSEDARRGCKTAERYDARS